MGCFWQAVPNCGAAAEKLLPRTDGGSTGARNNQKQWKTKIDDR